MVLYDLSSAAFEGGTCPLGALKHARDGIKAGEVLVAANYYRGLEV